MWWTTFCTISDDGPLSVSACSVCGIECACVCVGGCIMSGSIQYKVNTLRTSTFPPLSLSLSHTHTHTLSHIYTHTHTHTHTHILPPLSPPPSIIASVTGVRCASYNCTGFCFNQLWESDIQLLVSCQASFWEQGTLTCGHN